MTIHASTIKLPHVWSQDIPFQDNQFANMDVRFLLVFLVIVWFIMVLMYGLSTPDKEQIFVQLRALSIPAPEPTNPLALLDYAQFPFLADPQYMHEYSTRAQ